MYKKLSFKLLALFILLHLTFYINGQGGFKRKYFLQNSSGSTSADAIEIPNGDYLIKGFTTATQSNVAYNQLSMVCTDNQGIFLWRKNYGQPTFQYLLDDFASRGAIVTKSNCFYTANVVLDSNNIYLSVLMKFNYNGDTLWQKKYYTNVSSQPMYIHSLSATIDGGLLLTGQIEDLANPIRSIFLLKTDLDGNELWRKKYLNISIWAGYRSVQDTATKKIFTVGYASGGSENGTILLITDSIGTFKGGVTYSGNYGGIFGDVIQTKDKNFVAAGLDYKNEYFNGDKMATLYAVKFDNSGTQIWKKDFGRACFSCALSTVNELADGSLIFGGIADTNSYNEQGPVWFTKVIKTDPDGNVIWAKNIANSANSLAKSELIRSLNLTSDGGFIISTELPYAPNPTPYRLIKLNGDGCDSTEAYCLTLATGIKDLSDVSGDIVQLSPNPASNQVQVILSQYYTKNYRLMIYDVSGRQVESVSLEAAELQTINTEKFSAGVYLVKLYADNKPVATKRLVIVR